MFRCVPILVAALLGSLPAPALSETYIGPDGRERQIFVVPDANLSNDGAISTAIDEAKRSEKTQASFDLRLRFAYDSAALSRRARRKLAYLADFLQEPEFQDVRLLIEGHTDAAGSRSYNQDLSERRAHAVRRYLVELGLSRRRLRSVGYGEDYLLRPRRPFDGANRRVEFVIVR